MFKSKYCICESVIYVNDSMSGKMENVPCISTSNLLNPYCIKRQGDKTLICSKCFAKGTVSRYSKLNENISINTEILTSCIIDDSLLPIFGNVRFVRFEPFGDLINVNQAINYLNICRVNPFVQFTIWTKIPKILDKAIAECGKPENLICIVSSPKINHIAKCGYAWADKIFTVWSSEEECEKHGYKINCGKKSCVGCQLCYSHNDVKYVHELLK